MIACLDMYNWPESSNIFAAYWQHVHDHLTKMGIEAPINLTVKDEDLRQLADNAHLLLGQICGITYARNNQEHKRFVPLGAFVCDDEELMPGTYCSVVIAKNDTQLDLNKPQNLKAATNGRGSLSGWIALAQYFSGQSEVSPFADVLTSGSHRSSAEMVAQGQAEIAALDMISWKMLNQFDPKLTSRLKIVGRTQSCPGLPLVTSIHHGTDMIAALKTALYSAISEPEIKELMASIGIIGLHENDADTYLDLLKL